MSEPNAAGLMRNLTEQERAEAIAAAGDKVIDLCDHDTVAKILIARARDRGMFVSE